jgi:two-component system, chemotaxis family, chemotaxis protein CheY
MGRPTTALIVDDESHVRTFLRLLVREIGIETSWEAADGPAGLALVAERTPGLVLLDINLPGMGGLDVLAKLQAAWPEIPVVVVTSQSAMHTVRDAARLGAVGYILKHNAKDQIVESLRDVIDTMAGDEDGAPAPG